MSQITLEVLEDTTLLNEKLEEKQKEIEKVRGEFSDVITQQAELLERKIVKFTPIMKFLREKGYKMIHPTLEYHSSKGAVLDYDSENDWLYIYDVDSKWIQRVNMHNQAETKNVIIEDFANRRNLDNAIEGLNYLLVIQDEFKKALLQDKAKREQWLKENE